MPDTFKPLKVYKSSAGSGKTTTLALEYLKLALGKGDHFRHILALTFTNKAAQEMKERILEYLQMIIKYRDDSSSEMPFFFNQLIEESDLYKHLLAEKARQKIGDDAESLYKNLIHRYSEYAVTTIDSFTNRIIRSFSHDLGLSFNYQVELKTNLLIDLAVEELLSKVDQEEGLLTEILSEYSKTKINEEKSRNIRRDLRNRAKSLLNDLEEEYLVQLRQLDLTNLLNIQAKINQSIEEFESYLLKTASEFISICAHEGIDKASFYNRSAIYNYFERIANSNFSELEPNKTSQTTINEDKWTAAKVSSEQAHLIENNKADFIRLFEEIQMAVESFSDYNIRKEISKQFYPFMVLLELEKILNQMKAEQQMIHISDFNKVISKTVAHETAPYIYERIGNKFQHYLLDEFQDTSVLQWHNLLPLVENGISQNYFSLVVGDAKQSIYRWRGSDVKQFSEFPKLSSQTDDLYMMQRQNLLNQSFENIVLDYNYRTGKNIVDFNNRLFGFIKEKEFLPLSLTNIYDDFKQKIKKTETASFVQIQAIDAENAEETNDAYIHRCLELVQQCQQDGYPLKDIAILARRNDILIKLARYLLENDIPVISTESLHADSSPLVRFVLSFIQYLFHPLESLYQSEIIYFLSESASFKNLMAFNDLIQKNNPEKKLDELWKLLHISFDSEELIKSDTYEAIEQICEIFKLDRSDSLLHFFLEAAFVFSQENHQDLNAFLDWWSQNAVDYKLDVPEDWEAVKLLSFHKAKGLEFPVVINLFSDNHFINSGKGNEIWLNPKLNDIPELQAFPFSFSSLQNTKYDSVYQLEKDYESLDKINLFYVAMTRPKERLYVLIDQYHPPKNESSVAFKFSKTIAGFIKEENLEEVENQVFQFGQKNNVNPDKNKTEKEQNDQNLKLRNFKHDKWTQYLEMSLDTSDHLAASDWGTKVHRFFAQIKTEEDLKKNKLKYKQMLHLSDSELVNLEKQAQQVFQHPLLSKLYDRKNRILNEREIYSSEKEVLRPDRIVILDNKLYVIDYKTGLHQPNHIQQINKYCSQLSQITGLNSYGFLVYLQEQIEVIEIK